VGGRVFLPRPLIPDSNDAVDREPAPCLAGILLNSRSFSAASAFLAFSAIRVDDLNNRSLRIIPDGFGIGLAVLKALSRMRSGSQALGTSEGKTKAGSCAGSIKS
jgi:hypothetical protein